MLNIRYSVQIKNVRRYFFSRFLVYLLLRIPGLSHIVRLFFRNRPNLDISDVEQIFFIFNLERESENIRFIEELCSGFKPKVLFDIGSNYGQFSYSLKDRFKRILCLDANKEAICYIQSLNVSNISVFHKAIVSSKNPTDSVIFFKVPGNSGASSIYCPDGDFTRIPEVVPAITIRDFLTNAMNYVHPSVNLIKIDIEGLEADLISDYLELDFCDDIIAFEVLTKAALAKLNDVFTSRRGKYTFFTLRYSFLDISGLMSRNPFGLLTALITGNAAIDIWECDELIEFPFEFMSLVFAIPNQINLSCVFDKKIEWTL